ncbi:MAG: AAA family ATPase, partial [Desulfofustis sp.]|nr:AAA family ATPase [Desulfofustis sp.]
IRTDYPMQTINQEVRSFQDNLSDPIREHFKRIGVSDRVLAQMAIGYNGRYLVYPYVQDDGNCYTARCVFPDRPEDYFWHGDSTMMSESDQIFNVEDIQRCENGTLVLCEGEDNLLSLKQIGLPGIAVPDSQLFESIDSERFDHIRTLFIVVDNNAESETRARALASRVGYKVRLLRWPTGAPRHYSLTQLARDRGSGFSSEVAAMIRHSRAFSPFSSPEREYGRFAEQLQMQRGKGYASLKSGFEVLDQAIDGVHGINVFGGPPKAGKSCFMIQIGTELARRGVPVIYYDFENGRQKIYQRTLVRLSRVESKGIVDGDLSEDQRQRCDSAYQELQKLMDHFRVVNDRKLSPEIMRRHIDFIRHETRRDYCVVIVDSLHKLPFKDFSERRTGIDAWLRQFESIRDEFNVSFLIISELTRGDRGSYRETPHMGVFKGSGDIEYSADNALVMFPRDDPQQPGGGADRTSDLWLVASREHSPGLVAAYRLDYPFWSFKELDPDSDQS